MPPKKSSMHPPEKGKENDEISEDDETSSSDSENEGTTVKTSGVIAVLENEEDADEVFEKALKDELDQVIARSEAVNSLASDENEARESIEILDQHLLRCIQTLDFLNSRTNATFQDIMPQVVDGRKFIIDGDSLLMLARNAKGLSMQAGGQTLHVLYIVERFLQTFVSRGLNFSIVFFEVWDPLWRYFPSLSIARNCLRFHLQYNQTKFPVLAIKSLWSNQFSEFLQKERPGFIMMATALPKFIDNLVAEKAGIESMPAKWLQFTCGSQSIYCEFLCLDVVDIASVFSSPICLMGMVHVHLNNFKRVQVDIEKMIQRMEKLMPSVEGPELKTWLGQENDVKVSVTAAAAAAILNKDVNSETIEVVKSILLCTTMSEFTPLKMRCFKPLPNLPQQVSKVLKDFLREMGTFLGSLPYESDCLDFKRVGDLWQGLFFKAVFYSISKGGILERSKLENIIAHRYEELVGVVNGLVEEKFEPYPINVSYECDGGLEKVDISTRPVSFESIPTRKLLPSTCELVNLFCGDFASDTRVVSAISADDENVDTILHESRHWHSKKSMSDEYDRVEENKIESKEDRNSWWAQKNRNAMARYLTMYGSSLEGRSAPKTIVVNPVPGKQSSKKSDEKPKSQAKVKVSKKDKIIEDNIKRIRDEKQKQLKERLKKSSKIFESLMLKGDYEGGKEKCDIELKHVKEFNDFMMDVLFMKGEACFGMWKDVCNKKSLKRNLAPVKDIFLVTREIFKLVEEDGLALSTKRKNLLSAWIHELGLKEFAKTKGLLEDPNKSSDGRYSVGMNHVEFQLTHLGAELVRETGGKPDPRADGFIPDPWQMQLFDIIDKNQCAVVVAPTSSGKTYASYYCMEKVIRDSDHSVVVYVCPTKALVNQVHATIYARFKKNLPSGKSLLGTFTRDYKENVQNCQILVTVPECMELLLLGPRAQTWAKRIKFVIFDEVHCLVGQGGGSAWENSILLIRCPFLALSATIHKPEKFCAWLQQVETFKKAQAEKYGLLADRPSSSYKVNLVVHSDRHNHLLKNVMMNDGSIQHVHPYSFLNLANKEDYDGIPEYIALSPDESLQLYNAMRKIIPAERLHNLSVREYFEEKCPSGYLTMQSVKKFSDDLRNLLQKEEIETQIKVLKLLETVDYSELETGHEVVLNDIPLVMGALKERGMLPAIVFTYNRNLVNALPQRLLRHLRHLDDFTEDEDTDIEVDSDADDGKSQGGNKKHRRTRGKKYSKKLGLMRGPSELKSEGSLRGEGCADEKIIDFIEYRLMKCGHRSQGPLACLLRRGLGKHYSAMNARERSAVEMLFRSRVLNLITATGTLALGIHMPCKTVVLAGDSPFLNVLEFHQMSGRAGRRGYDKEGNVLFFGLNRRKLQTLMTGNLPQMIGNFPLSVTLILRLLLLVSDATYCGQVTEESSNEALARAFTVLENGLLYQTQPILKDRMRYFCFFVVQLLRRQGLLSLDGHLHPHALVLTHLHYKEPGNFAFYYLLKSGVLQEICQLDKKGNITEESLHNLLIVFNFLFARLPVSEYLLKKERLNSIVVLPPLPDIVYKKLEEYNSEVLAVFSHYFKCMSVYVEEKYGKETMLPLSQLYIEAKNILTEDTYGQDSVLASLNEMHSSNYVCSVFAGLSGNTDQDLFSVSGELVHIRDDLNVKIVPTVELNFQCNSYALDFFKHGNKMALCHDNGLKSGYDFEVTKDFLLVLKSLHVSLTEMLSPDDKLVKALEVLSSGFKEQFDKAYYAYRGVN